MTNQKKVPASDERKRNSKRRYYTKKRAPKKAVSLPPVEQEKVRISFLGGMNEIGKNMTLYEYKNDMFIFGILDFKICIAVLLFRQPNYRVLTL